jgi:glyoxylate/hydroxypyruvate reductase A
MVLLFISDVDDPVAWTAALAAHEPGLAVRIWPDAGALDDIEAALVWQPPPGLLARCPNLKLIQSLTAGIHHILADPDLPAGVPIARIVDPALTRQMVAYTVLAVLHHHRRIDEYRAFQARAEWRQLAPADPHACRVGVMGLGVIGAAAAEALARFDFAPETEGVLDADAFATLPQGAYVINIGRGAHLVEDDLVAAIDRGHLSGAWLDVCRSEPLPPASPLWRHPRITLTPHIAGLVLPRTASAQVIDNLRLVRAGAPPTNLVDPARGY